MSERPRLQLKKAPIPGAVLEGCSDWGWCATIGKKPTMEDGVVVQYKKSGGSFYAVLDGNAGDSAMLLLQRRLPELLSRPQELENPEAMAAAFHLLEDELLQEQSANPDEGGLSPGCVACAATITGSTVTICDIGDCQALLGTETDLVLLTSDHNMKSPSERQRLEAQGIQASCDGEYMAGGLAVTRGFGSYCSQSKAKLPGLLFQPETRTLEVPPDALFLALWCDGLVEKSDAAEVGKVIRRTLRCSQDPKRAAEEAIRHALATGSMDNLTVIVIPLKASSPTSEASSSTAPVEVVKGQASPSRGGAAQSDPVGFGGPAADGEAQSGPVGFGGPEPRPAADGEAAEQEESFATWLWQGVQAFSSLFDCGSCCLGRSRLIS